MDICRPSVGQALSSQLHSSPTQKLKPFTNLTLNWITTGIELSAFGSKQTLCSILKGKQLKQDSTRCCRHSKQLFCNHTNVSISSAWCYNPINTATTITVRSCSQLHIIPATPTAWCVYIHGWHQLTGNVFRMSVVGWSFCISILHCKSCVRRTSDHHFPP